jgi:hypothetical protein
MREHESSFSNLKDFIFKVEIPLQITIVIWELGEQGV